MAVVTLTFTGSTEEIVAGIPRYMTIASNVPSTIYYTVDGSTPDLDSAIYIDTFEMPNDENTVILSAFGVDSDGYVGSILTQTFSPDISDITVSRLIGSEGWTIDRYSDTTNTVLGYGPDDDGAVRYTDIPPYELNIIHSPEGFLGVAEGTFIEVEKYAPEDTPWPFDDQFAAVSSPENAEFFNPLAKTIINDERNNNDIRIINRPWGSIRSVSRSDWSVQELGGVDSTYISGGFLRRFYDTKNNVMVSYYFDHNECRYVKGIQDLPQNIPQTIGANVVSFPLVFVWIERGRHSSIPI